MAGKSSMPPAGFVRMAGRRRVLPGWKQIPVHFCRVFALVDCHADRAAPTLMPPAAPPHEDGRSVAALHARFHRPLLAYFHRRVAGHAEAEDLTQQVFVRLLGAPDLASLDQPDGYVFTIAANLLKDRNRSAARKPGAAPGLGQVEELIAESMEDRCPERVLLGKESLAGVLRALDELGEKTRDIFILFRLENMKQREIAALYGIGQSTVEKHVMKAMLHLARRFAADGTP